MMTDPLPQDTSEGTALYCPACGYDLRHTEEPRCSERGSAFDRNTLTVSRIPWVHRRELGCVRAWWRTVRFAILSPGKLAKEVSAPVSWADASRFRWSVVIGVAACATIVMATFYPAMNLKKFHAPFNPWASPSTDYFGGNLLFPLGVLLTGPGLMLVTGTALFAAGSAISWWLRLWFWHSGNDSRDRASAVSCYLMAWWIVPVFVGFIDIALAMWGNNDGPPLTQLLAFILIALMHLAAILGCALSVLLLFRRISRAGWLTRFFTAIVIPVGGVIVAIICALVATYTLGMLAIAIRSVWG